MRQGSLWVPEQQQGAWAGPQERAGHRRTGTGDPRCSPAAHAPVLKDGAGPFAPESSLWPQGHTASLPGPDS